MDLNWKLFTHGQIDIFICTKELMLEREQIRRTNTQEAFLGAEDKEEVLSSEGSATTSVEGYALESGLWPNTLCCTITFSPSEMAGWYQQEWLMPTVIVLGRILQRNSIEVHSSLGGDYADRSAFTSL